jgi:hypothetical protein
MKALDALSNARGNLVATDGVCEVRLSVERGLVDLEVLGHELPRALQGEQAIIRAVADTAFWDTPLYDVSQGTPLPLAESEKRPENEKRRLHFTRPEAPREVCRGIAEELAHLDSVRRRVPTLNLLAVSTPKSKEAKGGSAVAVKLRNALVKKPEGLSLHEWARAEGLSFVETASAFAELLEADEAKVLKKQDQGASANRIDAALKGGGFCPGLRIERAARALLPRDAARAGTAFARAGTERLHAGRVQEAIDCFTLGLASPQGLPDLGVAAYEGLLLALEADAKDQRRPAGTEARSPQERKEISLELGRAYFALGLMNRARAALEKVVDDNSPPRHQLDLIDALVGAGQLGKALERAEALAPSLDRNARRALAGKLVQGGAKGPSLERALALAGATSERRLATISIAATAIFTALALGFGLQARGASSLASASRDARAELDRKGPSPELARRFHEIGTRFALVPAGAKGRAAARTFDDLAADEKWLEGHASAFAWATSSDPDQARNDLRAVREGAKTEALRTAVQETIDALDQQVQQCRGDVERIRASIDAGDSPAALDAARGLVTRYPAWKGLFKDVKVPIRINVERPDSAIVEWNGEAILTTPPIVYLGLDTGTGTLVVRGERSSGWRREERHLDLVTCGATVSVSLQREANAPPLPDKKPLASAPINPNEPPRKSGKVFVGGSSGPDPEPQDTTNPDTTGTEKKPRFEVREVKGSDIQRLLGGAPTDIQPSTGYFDFLLAELPRDGRLHLTVDVVTTVVEHKVWLDHVTLRGEDTVLGHTVPPVEVTPEEKPERRVELQTNGRRTVFGLDRCVGLDQNKFKAAVRDACSEMVRGFNKREGQ